MLLALNNLLQQNQNKVRANTSTSDLVQMCLQKKCAFESPTGALVTWTETASTGRSPLNTFIVQNKESEKNIDWTSPTNLPIQFEIFESLWRDALKLLEQKQEIFVTDRVIGADAAYALPVKVVTDNPLASLFVHNMFRSVPKGIEKSVLAPKAFTLLVVPHDKVKNKAYPSDMALVMDFDRNVGLVFGSSYMGAVKKLLFTVMNFLTPEQGILPLHCSANEGPDQSSAVILGLSGTGKTTLSADPERKLIGDDEHAWSNAGVANFENGCYAKLINLRKNKEPEIFRITFEEKFSPNTVIIENAMMYPDGHFDVDDKRLTENSRVSYPLTALKNFKPEACSGHPKTILFLTADANGVLPPVAKLDEDQAMLWFLMGYTSKLAGTETGVTEPKSAFSRFFGGPFMPRNPEDYTRLLKEKIQKHQTQVFLINTGWSGGPYGVGARMDIALTRGIVNACLNGDLENVKYEENKLFHFSVPCSCPGVEAKMLNPMNTWADSKAYEARAKKLAQEFSDFFDKNFSHVGDELRRVCPGK